MRRWLLVALAIAAPMTAWAGSASRRGLQMRLVPPPGTAAGRCAELRPFLSPVAGTAVSCLDAGRALRVDLPGARPLRLTVRAPDPADLARSLVHTVDGLLAGRLGLEGAEAREASRLLFAAGLPEGGRFTPTRRGLFRDRLTGRRLRFDSAFALYRASVPKVPAPGWTAVDVAGALTAGSLWYWTATGVNAPDWQYAYFGDSLYKKLVTFEAWRFDDNPIHLNSPGHAFGGGAYYLLARSNGLGWGAAFGTAVAGSLLWELIPEYREILGVNDLVIGSFGGTAVGESFLQLGRLFARARGGLGWQLLSVLFGAPEAVGRLVSGTAPVLAPETDAFGLPADVGHLVEVFLGTRATELSAPDPWRGDGDFGFDTEVFLLPEHLSPVTVSRFVPTPVRTELGLRMAYGPSARLDLAFHAGAVLAGYHDQAIVPGPGGDRGHSLLLGVGTDYRHLEEPLPGLTDYLGVAGLAGPVLDLFVLDGPWRLRVQGELYPDFALVRALALPAYRAAHGLAGAKTTLLHQGYYDARGVTGIVRLHLDRGPVGVGVDVTADRFDSIEGLDRFQSEVTDDFHLVDTRLSVAAFARLRVPGTATVVTLRYEAHHRTGAIREVTATADVRAISVLLGWDL